MSDFDIIRQYLHEVMFVPRYPPDLSVGAALDRIEAENERLREENDRLARDGDRHAG